MYEHAPNILSLLFETLCRPLQTLRPKKKQFEDTCVSSNRLMAERDGPVINHPKHILPQYRDSCGTRTSRVIFSFPGTGVVKLGATLSSVLSTIALLRLIAGEVVHCRAEFKGSVAVNGAGKFCTFRFLTIGSNP